MIIETKRTKIRKLKYRDWQDLAVIFADFEQSSYRDYDAKMPLDPFGVKLVIGIDLLVGGYYTVLRKEDDAMLGYISTLGIFQKEIGYAFKQRFQGQGYALEAVEGVLAYLHEEKGYDRFKAVAALENKPSVRLLDRLGFTMVKTRQMYLRMDRQGRPLMFTAGVYQKEVGQ